MKRKICSVCVSMEYVAGIVKDLEDVFRFKVGVVH